MTNGIKYTYGITAQNDLGYSSPTTLFRRVAPGFKPQQVASVAAYPQSDTSVLVTWVSSGVVATPPIEWFVAKAISSNGGDPILARSQYPYLSNVLISSLNAASPYRFYVYAVNDPGYSIPVYTPFQTIPAVNSTDLIVYLSVESYPGYGAWPDRSGNNYNAVIENGTATLNAAGNGLVLNGSTNWRFPPTGSNGIGSYSNFTTQVWFKQTANQTSNAAIVTETLSGSTINMALYSPNGGSIYAGGFYSSLSYIGKPYTYANNEWHNMAITWNGTNLTTYIDGYSIGSSNYSATASSALNKYYRIGRGWDSSNYITGEIGQVLIYGRALSGAEVLENVSSYAYKYPTNIQNVALSTIQAADSSLTISWEEVPDTGDVTVTFFQTPTNNVFTGGSTIAAPFTVVSPSTTLTRTLPLTHNYYYFGTVGLVGGTQYSSATNYYPYPVLSTATMQNITLYSANMRVNYTMNGYLSTSAQFYSNTDDTSIGRTALSSLVYTGPGVSSVTLSTNNYPLLPKIWYSAEVTILDSGTVITASSLQVSSPTYSPFFLSTLVPSATSLTAKWTSTPPYPAEVQFYVANSANPTGVFSTLGPLLHANSSISSITYNTTISTGSYYFAGIAYSTGTISTFTSSLLAPNSLSNVTISSLTYEANSLTGFFRVSPPANVSLDFYSNATATVTGGTLLSTVTVLSGAASNATVKIQPNTGIYYYTVGRTTGQPNITSPSATQGLNPFSSLSLSSLTAYATSLTANWFVAYNSSITLSFFSTNVLTATGGGLISTIVTDNGTSSLTIGVQPYPSTLYYIRGTYTGQPTISTVSSIAMPSPITNVLLDQMTINSTDFASSWTAAPATAVTVRYYSTTSSAIPGTRNLIGSAQSVASNVSTNSLSPAQAPLAAVYYYVGVTPALGPEVLSPTAVQLVDPFPSNLKGSIQFTGGYLSLTSNWTLPIYGDPFTIEMFISTTLPLATSPKTNTFTNWGDPDNYNAINSFEIQKTSGNDYYLVSLANQRPTGNISALVPTVVDGGWHHIVAQGLNSTYSLYYDGKFAGSRDVGNYSTLSTFNNFTVGGYGTTTTFNGLIASLRIVNGINVYSGSNTSNANFTVPTQPLTATQGSNTNILAITGVNQNTEPQYSSFPIGSMKINPGGGARYIKTLTATPTFGTGNWTYETFIYLTNNNNQELIAAINDDGTTNIYSQLRIQKNNDGDSNFIQLLSMPTPNSGWGSSNSFNVAVGPSLSLNTWYHLAAVRNGNDITWYNNGVSTFSFTTSTSGYILPSPSYTTLGGAFGNQDFNYTGAMANMRLTTGTAVYTSNFTPPSTNLTVQANTTFLLLTSSPATLLTDATSNYSFRSSADAVLTYNGLFPPVHFSTNNNYTSLLLDTYYNTPYTDKSSNAYTMGTNNTSNGTVVASPANPFGPTIYPLRVPDAPTNVVGTPGTGQVVVTWSLPLSNGGAVITSYTITAVGGASFTVSGASVTTYTFTGLTNGTAYTFTVYATNSVGNSPVSAASSAVTPRAIADAPTSLVATHGNTTASIAFTPGSTNGGTLSNYKYSTDGGTNFTAFSPAQTSSPVSITGLTNGTTYSVKLKAVTEVGDGTASAAVSVTPSTVSGAPTSVSGTHGNTQVALTWSAPSSTGGAAIDYYTAYYSTDGTNYTTFGSTFSSTSGTVTGLTNGTAYTFKITAHNLNGNSALSTASSAVTPSTVPGAPTDLQGTFGDAQVALTWTAPSNTGGATISSYTVAYTTDNVVSTLFSPSFTTTSGTVTGLTNGVGTFFFVYGTNLNGNSPYSAETSSIVPLMTWNPAMKGVDVVISSDGTQLSQQFGYRQSALGKHLVSSGEKVMYSVEIKDVGPSQTMTLGWGTSTMHYNGNLNAYDGYPGTDDQSIGVDISGNFFYNGAIQVSSLTTYGTVGDIVDVALHDGVGWWIRVNGSNWNNDPTANPATDTGGLFVSSLTNLYPAGNPAGGGRADGALQLISRASSNIPSGYTFL